VVCLDCGKQFEYDTNKMRIGKRIDSPKPVLPPRVTSRPKVGKLKYAALAALPAAIALGAIFKPRKLRPAGTARDADHPSSGHPMK